MKSFEYPKKALSCIIGNWIGEDGQIAGDPSKLCAGGLSFLVKNLLATGWL